MKASFAEKQHSDKWRGTHNWEMALVLALERQGYSRAESRQIAERYRRGEPLLVIMAGGIPAIGHNGGPPLDSDCGEPSKITQGASVENIA